MIFTNSYVDQDGLFFLDGIAIPSSTRFGHDFLVPFVLKSVPINSVCSNRLGLDTPLHIQIMTSVSDAPDDNSIGDEELGYIITPLPDFKVLARDIQNKLRKSHCHLNGAMHT